jgi:uncharacterized protein DUF4062
MGAEIMTEEGIHTPALHEGVMVSSTFLDLKKHRLALMEALRKEDLFAVGMEDYVPDLDDDVISSSLNMVRRSSAYIGLISHRYGQIPESAERNPNAHSITQLEFEEAQRLGLPTLIFILGKNHAVIPEHHETDPEKRQKLEAYRERAKDGRIYYEVDSLEEFTRQAPYAVASLRRLLDRRAASAATHPQDPTPVAIAGAEPDPIPKPPAFYAEPRYIGAHGFVGRQGPIDALNDWAIAADTHPVLLFEAIGGTGKSMLTWEWTTNRATDVRDDWAGIFWYSFYERGAQMADFCRHALAYITEQPLKDFQKKKTPELGEMLLHHLNAKPWLIVFDGLERVLVAYNRIDAAQLADEDAGKTDEIADRDPCAAIRPEDDELLRALAGASPSKLLLTSRLVPHVLLNPASLPIPGVLRKPLRGLRPADAEALFVACGVTGRTDDIQNYLRIHCDCHPLVIGVLAGLVTNYLPDRGNFDAWAADPAGGGKLSLADLDLVQKRNHILHTALAALPEKSRQLLSTLALLSEAVDYPILSALNPHLPPKPEEVKEPEKPEDGWWWASVSDDNKKQAKKDYDVTLQQRREYEQALEVRQGSPEFLAAPQRLAETVHDLEHRGLLQYDRQTRRYDLHPVVRGIAAGGLRQDEKELYGQRVVDHFSQHAHRPYEEAETLEDLRDGLHVVRTLLQMGRNQQAADVYRGSLALGLSFSLEAHAETLSLLRHFFPQGWATLPSGVDASLGGYLANDAGVALEYIGATEEAIRAYTASLEVDRRRKDWRNLATSVRNVSAALHKENRLARSECHVIYALDIATHSNYGISLFRARLDRFLLLALLGQWTKAMGVWLLLDPMGRDWDRATYRPGQAELHYAQFLFWQGLLTEEHLTKAEELARDGKCRRVIRGIYQLRGEWQLEQDQYALGAENLHEAVRMAREVGQTDAEAEAQLALARFHLGQLPEPRHEAERLAVARKPFHRGLAELWLTIGDHERAKKHALAAYEWAWADGEPYVRRYELDKARALLEQLGEAIPDLPPYDSAKDERLSWEDDVVAAIAELKAESEAKRAAEQSAEGQD